ncbi:MAG: response regulator [Candidatus Coatesbacteria bacterium]|nr:response regulator [Candidatus Coatesbacteria bacterium]
MAERVLFVDDDPNILAGFRRQLHKLYEVHTAEGGQAGLELVVEGPPFAVIVADMNMPGIDGIQFLSQVKEISPNTVRMMLTGQSEMQVAAEAINEGSIFRFLSKPCPPSVLHSSLMAGIEQYRLITAEKELLEKTLGGSVKVLSDVLALTRTKSFGHAQRVKRLVGDLLSNLKVEKTWEMDVATMLSQIGCVTVPDEVLLKIYRCERVTEDEKRMFNSHPEIGADLIRTIPRLGDVARVIAYQEKGFDGSGVPEDTVTGDQIPLCSRLLKAALDFDKHIMSGCSQVDALQKMTRRSALYDPTVLKALRDVIAAQLVYEIKPIGIDRLKPGMILGADVRTAENALLIPKGHEITATLIWRLSNFAKIGMIPSEVSILVRTDGDPIEPTE